MPKSRTPLTLGWEAARANAVPALVIQAIMLALLIAYYTNHSVFSALNQLADYKSAPGLTFVIVASITTGAIIPEIFLILFFQRGRPKSRNFRNLLFTVPVWGLDGSLVDLLYRSEAAWFGDVVTLRSCARKFVWINLVTIHSSPRHSGCSPMNGIIMEFRWGHCGIGIRFFRHCWRHGRSGFR
jgi:hypothetical protein